MKRVNLIPEVKADWAGMHQVATRIMYVLVAANVAAIAYVISGQL